MSEEINQEILKGLQRSSSFSQEPATVVEASKEQIDQPIQIEAIDLRVGLAEKYSSVTEKYLDLYQRHRQLELQTQQLRSEIEFAVNLIHRMESNQEHVANVVAKRLADALQKFKTEDIGHDDKAA